MAIRTVTEMVDQIRLYMLDDNGTASNEEYSDQEIITKMQIAANTVWDLLVEHETGRRHLRKVQGPQLFTANIDTYLLPSDARRIEKIQVRTRTGLDVIHTSGTVTNNAYTGWTGTTTGQATVFIDDEEYNLTALDFSSTTDMDDVAGVLQTALQTATSASQTITYNATTDQFIVSAYGSILGWKDYADGSGVDVTASGFMNNVTSASTFSNNNSHDRWQDMIYAHDGYSMPQSGMDSLFGQSTGRALAWCDDTREGYIRMSPVPTNANEIYRIWYYREPTFPTVTYTAGAINTGGTSSLDTGSPTDLLIEYYATSLLMNEELENINALGHFAGLFSQQFALFAESRGAGSIKPQRHYIKRKGH